MRHRLDTTQGLSDGGSSERSRRENALGSPAAHWRRVTVVRHQQAFLFQALQRDEDSLPGRLPAGPALDFVGYRERVSIACSLEHGEHNQQLELAKNGGPHWGHD
jgi:hypothetical protein